MLTFTTFEGGARMFAASDIDEARPGAFSDLGGGARLILINADVVPVREDFDSIEAMLADAGLSGFDRADVGRSHGACDAPDRGEPAPRPVVSLPVMVRIDTTGWEHPD